MNRFVFSSVLLCVAAVCGAQTLKDELNKSGIPAAGFRSAELAQGVNAASARDGNATYLVYMRVDEKNTLSGFPQAVRYEPESGKVLRRELTVGEEQNCCGSPLGISFSRSYELFEFHLTPSASIVVVADRALRAVEILLGFGVQEIAPDEVIFTENMIHFAPAHPERIMLVNLGTGAARQLYPPKGDTLRAAFARDHEAKMPSQEVCGKMDDPCRPDYYDEQVGLLNADGPRRITMRFSRDATHAFREGEPPDTVLSRQALYVYERRKEGWFYCSVPVTNITGEKANCNPELPVESEEDADSGSYVKKVN
jgi:hypothetical protein